MSFSSYNGVLRKLGRKVVLPVEYIQKIIDEVIAENKVDFCVDFGAGTLFWADYLKGKNEKIYAIDIIYEESKVVNGIKCVKDLDSVDADGVNGLFFLSDVLHHLDADFEQQLFKYLFDSKQYKTLIIKDIDCNKKIGNKLNRLHDKVINGEDIRDINPKLIMELLQRNGYDCKVMYKRRLWYPHFIIVAVR